MQQVIDQSWFLPVVITAGFAAIGLALFISRHMLGLAVPRIRTSGSTRMKRLPKSYRGMPLVGVVKLGRIINGTRGVYTHMQPVEVTQSRITFEDGSVISREGIRMSLVASPVFLNNEHGTVELGAGTSIS